MLDILQKARSAFCGDSERELLIANMRMHHPPEIPVVLDVGTGDGSFARVLFSRLDRSADGRLVAIDPGYMGTGLQPDPRHKFVRSKLEMFTPTGSFTCINIRQSAYYLKSPQQAVMRAIQWLRPGGILAVTLWTKECILWRINEAIIDALGAPGSPLDLEQMCSPVVSDGRFQLVIRRSVIGQLDAATTAKEAATAEAIFNLAARVIDVSRFSSDDRVSFVRNFLSRPHTKIARANEVRIYKRTN